VGGLEQHGTGELHDGVETPLILDHAAHRGFDIFVAGAVGHERRCAELVGELRRPLAVAAGDVELGVRAGQPRGQGRPDRAGSSEN